MFIMFKLIIDDSYQMFVETVNILQNISDIDIICTKPFFKS